MPPRSRYTIWVNEIPGLASGDVSAAIASTEDIVVERAMYLDAGGPFTAGHAASAVTAPALGWFLAEGATGSFFDEYILLANPSTSTAQVQIDYLLPDGMVVPRTYDLAPESRLTIRVDEAHPWLANTAVSARIRSLNGVPFVAERSMWWADGGWFESHNSPGAVETGTRWLVSAGEVGGPRHTSTYVLLANTSPFAGQARVTILLEGGGTLERTFPVAATSRFNVDVGTLFPETDGRRFGTLVESLGADPAELVVEWSIYGTPGPRPWELGANALAMNLSTPLHTLPDRVLVRGAGTTTIDAFRAVAGAARPTFSVTSSAPGVATVTIHATTGALQLTPGSATGSTTVTVTARVSGQPDVVDQFVLTVGTGRAITFAAPTGLGSQLFPAFADMNNDGRLELAGTVNDGSDARRAGPARRRARPARRSRRHRRPPREPSGRRQRRRPPRPDHVGLPAGDQSPEPRPACSCSRPTAPSSRTPPSPRSASPASATPSSSADLDNDGDVDLFMVEYTHNHPDEQLYLLLNDGQGHFTEVADAAGVATRGWPAEQQGGRRPGRRLRRRRRSRPLRRPAISSSTRASPAASRASPIAAPRSACRCGSTKGCASSTSTTTDDSTCCCTIRAKGRSCGASPARSSRWCRCRCTSTTAATAPMPAT